MGSWSKREFLTEEPLGEIGFLFAGHTKPELEKQIVDLFDEVVTHQDKITHNYVLKKDDKTYPICFNVYGSSMANERVWHMYDGGVKTIILLASRIRYMNNPREALLK